MVFIRGSDSFCLFFIAIVSAPVWDSKKSAFAGLLTSTDYINVIQYYYQYPDEFHKLDQFRLSSLRGELTWLSVETPKDTEEPTWACE
jgi:hypothetical protein